MKRILIVDDDQDLSFLTSSVLKMAGYAVHICHEVGEVEDYLKTNKVDLIMLDVMMPNMNGGDILKRLKKQELDKGAQVFFLSGLVESIDHQAPFLVIDGQKYEALGKPFEMQDLLTIVKRHIGEAI